MTLHAAVTAVQAAGLLDPEGLIRSLGPWALAAIVLIVFAECGLLIGFFLPGDSLLFAAGLLTAGGFISTPIAVVCLLITVAAILGNATGYWIGHRFGPAVFNRPDSRLFRQEYVDKTHDFFEKYGGRAIVLARFTPIVRTFITVMAGVARMPFRVFMVWTLIGGVLWGTGITLLGYWLGNVPFIKNNLELMAIGVVILSLVPVAFELWRGRRRQPMTHMDPVDDLDGTARAASEPGA